ncbi:class I SAM-dependent methyltransferase [Streptomyces sp. ALB3]|uniref:class I SAM-dependent methyltransferase n=1 Tax=Streptomyces sp. ALB3 TaxID=3374278 RepID=UPI00379DCF2C
MRLDASGKVSLDHIYTAPDPRTYFQVLRPLGYRVPQLAKPYFEKTVKEYGEAEQVAAPRVLDIGCSYGINAALLKYDATMDELYARYDGSGPATRAGLIERDRHLSRSRTPAHPLRFTGLDASAPALAYAREAGFLDDTVNADLESHDPTPRQRDRLAGTDVVISTGCIGYVTERTLTRVVRAQDGRLPWMAHFVLRMFPFGRVEAALEELGYRTTRVDEVFRQRRFAGPQEQRGVLDSLAAAGVDASGLEEDGWLYAQLYLSRPRNR